MWLFLESENVKEILMSVVHGAVDIPDPQVCLIFCLCTLLKFFENNKSIVKMNKFNIENIQHKEKLCKYVGNSK